MTGAEFFELDKEEHLRKFDELLQTMARARRNQEEKSEKTAAELLAQAVPSQALSQHKPRPCPNLDGIKAEFVRQAVSQQKAIDSPCLSRQTPPPSTPSSGCVVDNHSRNPLSGFAHYKRHGSNPKLLMALLTGLPEVKKKHKPEPHWWIQSGLRKECKPTVLMLKKEALRRFFVTLMRQRVDYPTVGSWSRNQIVDWLNKHPIEDPQDKILLLDELRVLQVTPNDRLSPKTEVPCTDCKNIDYFVNERYSKRILYSIILGAEIELGDFDAEPYTQLGKRGREPITPSLPDLKREAWYRCMDVLPGGAPVPPKSRSDLLAYLRKYPRTFNEDELDYFAAMAKGTLQVLSAATNHQ